MPFRFSSTPTKPSRSHDDRSELPRPSTTTLPQTSASGKGLPSPSLSKDGLKNHNQVTQATESPPEETMSEQGKSGMGCGPDGGGMVTSFMWLDSVNSTMDEVKSLIVKRKVQTNLWNWSSRCSVCATGSVGTEYCYAKHLVHEVPDWLLENTENMETVLPLASTFMFVTQACRKVISSIALYCLRA